MNDTRDTFISPRENMTKVIQVTNVSPLASAQNVREIFSYLGDIDEIKVYPERYVL